MQEFVSTKIFLFAILTFRTSIALELQSDENEKAIESLETGKESLTTRSKPNPLNVEVFKDLEGEPMIQNMQSTKTSQDVKKRYNFSEAEMIKHKIWPNGIAPYYIDTYSFDGTSSNLLRQFIDQFNSLSSFRLIELSQVPDNEDDRWLLFINRRDVLQCQDYNTNSFTTKGVQKVVVGYDCFDYELNQLIPILLAIAGVPPQHNAPNRNEYITVVMENVMPEKRHMFEILKDDEWLFHHLKNYDFNSGGHYDFHKYSINGSATIIPRVKVNTPVGEQNGISADDISKLMTLYTYSSVSNHRTKSKASDCYRIFKSNKKNHEYEKEEETYVPLKTPNKKEVISSDDNISSKISSEDLIHSKQQKTLNRKDTEQTNINKPTKHVKDSIPNTLKALPITLKRPKNLQVLKKKLDKRWLSLKKELKEIIKHKIDYRTSSEK